MAFGPAFLEATNLYKHGAHSYAAATVRFNQTDPAGQEVNPYSYAGHNPLNGKYPTGRSACSYTSSVVAGGAAVICQSVSDNRFSRRCGCCHRIPDFDFSRISNEDERRLEADRIAVGGAPERAIWGHGSNAPQRSACRGDRSYSSNPLFDCHAWFRFVGVARRQHRANCWRDWSDHLLPKGSWE